MAFSMSSRSRLTAHDYGRFAGDTVLDRIGRAVCAAGCLPRKELFEAWEVARRTRRLFRGGRVVDLAGGHGLLAHIMLILDDSSPDALVVDKASIPCAEAVWAALVDGWPRLSGRIRRVAAEMAAVELLSSDIVVASHACGRLTDVAIDRAVAAGARLAVLPCCHDVTSCDGGGLEGWMDSPLAIDAVRALRLRASGYRIWTQTIPSAITPKNRLLLGAPGSGLENGASRCQPEGWHL